jgi:abnormal spindle-like microcephaly-associated protein
MITEENSVELGKTYLHQTHQVQEKALQQTFKISADVTKSHSVDDLAKNLTIEEKSNLDVSTMSTRSEVAYGTFKENEIRAQSSCLNLNEIGRGQDCSILRRSFSESDGFMAISPPKGPNKNEKSHSSLSLRQKNCPMKRLKLVKKQFLPPPEPQRVVLFDSEKHLKSIYNPDAFAATTTADPFLISTMYMDERTIDRNEKQITKWLNALVTIPADLDADSSQKVDIGKLFNEVKNKELILAPTKELVSSKYYKNRLDTLRSAGISLYTSEELAIPLKKVTVQIDKDMLSLRKDQNLHLDLVLQKNILELLLCFNPMWLRLGLEITYGEEIQMNSVRDMVGLSSFIVNRLFKDRYLEAKHNRLSADYEKHMKKFTFKRFLCLLFFLDSAKSRKLIKHNPCLFVKNAPYKETREILIRFASYLVSSVGDIVKFLSRFGYKLTHKQTYLDEFDYAFKNLAVDLRDGIRLTRVMEIILLREDLSPLLRVPSISRLQKVHNVNLAMKALSDAGFEIKGKKK